MKAKVLIACEESQTVCKAFRDRGFEAYSCDIQEPSGNHPEWHILGDALEAIKAEKNNNNGKILSWNDPLTAKARSKTFPGIAEAMAEQWGCLL